MPVKLTELFPKESEIVIKKKTYELKAFGVAARVWATYYFATKKEPNGMINLSNDMNAIDAKPERAKEVACIVAFKLLKDKTAFEDYEDLMEKAGYTHLLNIYKALCECFGVSEHHISNIEKEMAEIKKPQEEIVPMAKVVGQ